MSVSIDFSELHQIIDIMAQKASNTGPVMQDIAKIFAKKADEQFDKGGPGWQALAPSTVKSKHSSLILVDSTSNMRKSIKGSSGSDFAEVTIDSPAGFHAEGGPRLPVRDPLIFFSDETVNEASSLIISWILE